MTDDFRLSQGGSVFTLLRVVPRSQVLSRQLPAFAISLIIAELFYKFHSFSLECLAFLGTWYVVDLIIQRLVEGWQGGSRRL
jgi:hypothetical protein